MCKQRNILKKEKKNKKRLQPLCSTSEDQLLKTSAIGEPRPTFLAVGSNQSKEDFHTFWIMAQTENKCFFPTFMWDGVLL